jgi:hypothetical protein
MEITAILMFTILCFDTFRLRNVRWTTYFVSAVLMWTVMVKKIPSIRSLWYSCLDYAMKMFGYITAFEKLSLKF